MPTLSNVLLKAHIFKILSFLKNSILFHLAGWLGGWLGGWASAVSISTKSLANPQLFVLGSAAQINELSLSVNQHFSAKNEENSDV